MHRALVGDLLQARALLFGEWTGETDRSLDAVNVAFCILRAFLTIFTVDPALSQTHRDLLEWPLLSSRIERHRHRDTTAECRE